LTVYADSSFIAPLYVIDVHSAEARRRMGSRPELCLTPLNRAEVANALYQQVFRARMSEVEVRLAWDNFEWDCTQGIWNPVDLPERTWQVCIELARRYGPTLGVRTLDSLHVACALELKARKFWTFDERQARLAQEVGLETGA